MPKEKTKDSKKVVKSVHKKTMGRKPIQDYDKCLDLVKLGQFAAQMQVSNSSSSMDNLHEGHYVVSLEVDSDRSAKALLELLSPLINFILNLLQRKAKQQSNKIKTGDINISGTSNGPNSPVNVTYVNIVFNINAQNKEKD